MEASKRKLRFETAQTHSNTSKSLSNARIQIETLGRVLIEENQHNRLSRLAKHLLSEKRPNLINKFLDKQKLEKISFPASVRQLEKDSKGELATNFDFQTIKISGRPRFT